MLLFSLVRNRTVAVSTLFMSRFTTLLATSVLIFGNVVGSSPLPKLTLAEALNQVSPQPPESEEVVEEPETVERWSLPGATVNETKLVSALQERGIEDKNAIATVLGNVKQESKFHSNICEGGARVGFWSCTRGGYGLIQWTTKDRYMGLYHHSNRIGMDPSTPDAQISYLFTERQWRHIEPSLKNEGRSINYYMGKAYYWLGWGHHGARTTYAHNYAQKLIRVEVEV